MLDLLAEVGLGVGGGVSVLAIGALSYRFEVVKKSLEKVIKEGSEDLKHERAVKTFESCIKAAIRCIGYETRGIQHDKDLVGRPEDVSYRFNAVWLNEWKEMLRSISGATYKGKGLELYLHSALTDWNKHRDELLVFLLKEMNGIKTPIDNLEKYLSSFKHTLEYGAENWLNSGLLHQEEPKLPKPVKIKKPKAEVPVLEEETKLENA